MSTPGRRMLVVLEETPAGWRAVASTPNASSVPVHVVDESPALAAREAVERVAAGLTRCRCAVLEGVLRLDSACPKHGARASSTRPAA